MKATLNDCHANVEIKFNSQAEAILSPDKSMKLLPCDECNELHWKRLNVVSFLCPDCYKEYQRGEACDRLGTNDRTPYVL